MTLNHDVLFGNSYYSSGLNSRRPPTISASLGQTPYGDEDQDDTRSIENENGILDTFFGFMFEDPLLDHEVMDDEILRVKTTMDGDQTSPALWNPLNTSLFLAYSLSCVAVASPSAMIPAMSESLAFTETQDPAAFAPRATAYAVLGTAFGKFMLSFMGDIFGARRTSVVASIMVSLSLLVLSLCRTADAASWAFGLIEWWHSAIWPCIIVVLATHYRRNGNAAYEGGIFVTSLASRVGVLVGIPLSSLLLRKTNNNWRLVLAAAAWAGLVSSSITYLFIQDSASQINHPQNPIDPQLWAQFQRRQNPYSVRHVLTLIVSVFQSNVAPSIKHVLQSPVFYIVAIAHTGSSAVRTSERVVGTYYMDTSMGTLSENHAGGLAVFLSFGTILGLMVAGSLYAKGAERQRKSLVINLYVAAILSCYVLAILAIPWLRNSINAPPLILIFQVMTTFIMGFSINAGNQYQMPSLVGATFGCDKGLYVGYTDGVAYGLSSLVWRLVGNSVQGDGDGAGWAYGWAAVALILIISAVFMVEFMEHYLVRPCSRTAGGYETIIFA